MKKRDKKRIIICMIIILIILLILMIYLYSKKESTAYEDTNKFYEEMQNEMVKPNGIFLLTKNYKGKRDLNDFYRSIYNLSSETIKLSKTNEKDIESYYEKNRAQLKRNLTVSNVEEFKEYKTYLDGLGKLKSLTSASIDTNSFKDSNRYLEFKMILKFDVDKSLKYDVKLANKEGNDKLVKFVLTND